MQQSIIVTMTESRSSVINTLMMISSIRKFAGSLADNTIWVLAPRRSWDFSDGDIAKFMDLKARIIPFDIENELLEFPFGNKVQAAAFAEELAAEQTNLLIWLDCDTLVLNDLQDFSLPPNKVLGYRPVHHKLIGVLWDDIMDPFWTQVYQECGTPLSKDFAMMTHIGEKIRPYFNAGTFVIRPEKKLLSQWQQVFQKCFRLPKFQEFYEKDDRYATFMHQAIFSGILLNALNQAELLELNHKINYPLHLHQSIPLNLRPKTINELITVRHENIIGNPVWRKGLPILEPLLSWLNSQLNFQDLLDGNKIT
ncbi:MAG: hypothetical protein MUO40_04490 [Anaerolineaceae bacterium]|nr:hypothetical protein [Anaerolineaceae bacterium]